VVFRKTSISLMTTYLLIALLFLAPLATEFFANRFFPRAPAATVVRSLTFTSPIRAAFGVPLELELGPAERADPGSLAIFSAYVAFTATLNAVALLAVIWLFNSRWRVSDTR
jgi:hypothetical protein